MSRRGNCHDTRSAKASSTCSNANAFAAAHIKTREQARQDIFDYIEMLYNPKRKHVRNGMLSPVDFENRQRKTNQEGV